MTTSPQSLKAVIFDLGGVVYRSPFIAIAQYEREKRIPSNYLNCSIAARGPEGAWQKFERGELPLFDFYKAFSRDLSDTVNGNIWYEAYCQRKGIACPQLPESLDVNGRDLFGRMMRDAGTFDEHIIRAIHRIRGISQQQTTLSLGLKKRVVPTVPQRLSELDYLGWTDGPTPPQLRSLFDDVCDSSELGLRKPDPEFYILACKRNNIRPQDAVFLDDLRINLNAARKLGMDTIHVPIGGTFEAVKALEERLGIDLTSSSAGHEVKL